MTIKEYLKAKGITPVTSTSSSTLNPGTGMERVVIDGHSMFVPKGTTAAANNASSDASVGSNASKTANPWISGGLGLVGDVLQTSAGVYGTQLGYDQWANDYAQKEQGLVDSRARTMADVASSEVSVNEALDRLNSNRATRAALRGEKYIPGTGLAQPAVAATDTTAAIPAVGAGMDYKLQSSLPTGLTEYTAKTKESLGERPKFLGIF